ELGLLFWRDVGHRDESPRFAESRPVFDECWRGDDRCRVSPLKQRVALVDLVGVRVERPKFTDSPVECSPTGLGELVRVGVRHSTERIEDRISLPRWLGRRQWRVLEEFLTSSVRRFCGGGVQILRGWGAGFCGVQILRGYCRFVLSAPATVGFGDEDEPPLLREILEVALH